MCERDREIGMPQELQPQTECAVRGRHRTSESRSLGSIKHLHCRQGLLCRRVVPPAPSFNPYSRPWILPPLVVPEKRPSTNKRFSGRNLTISY